MAEHNLVHLYGSVILNKIMTDPETQEFRRATLFLNTLRSSRPYQGKNEENELVTDQVMVMSQNPAIIKQLANIKTYDILVIKGTLNTRNINKVIECKGCGQKFPVNASSESSQQETSMITFVSPICVDVRDTDLTQEESQRKLISYREMSNEATMIGNLCGDVKRVEQGHAVAYQIGIDRKFYLRDDDPNTRADYPYVRVYGEQANNDFKYLHKGSMVLIDGMIQLRKFHRVSKCPYCGQEIEWQNSVLEIVPYSTEYLQNYITQEEYEKIQEEKAKAAEAQVFGPAYSPDDSLDD